MTTRRAFLLGLGGLAATATASAYAQVWRKVCLASTLLTDCPIYTPPVTGRGYFGGGGSILDRLAEIDGIDFTTEAAINPAATLALARSDLAGVNSSTRGYFGGGYSGSYSTEIDGIDFVTEAAINPAATLAVARAGLAGVNSSARGYFGGGLIGASHLDEIDGIDFPTEAAINPAAALAVARGYLAGVQSGAL
jgi:hypothetical protein